MPIVLVGLGAAAWVLASLVSIAALPAQAAAPPMRIAHVTVKPTTVTTTGVITFTAQIQGFRLSVKHIGKEPISGEGHLQYYLDRIPSDAWSETDYHHGYLMAVGTNIVIFGLKTSRVKISRGRHHILVALAKNDGILYHAPTVQVTVTVK
jgi:hypothetical protein